VTVARLSKAKEGIDRIRILPAAVEATRDLQGGTGRRVELDLLFRWEIGEGSGMLSSASDQEVSFQAPRRRPVSCVVGHRLTARCVLQCGGTDHGH
jgi:hypothetical protein